MKERFELATDKIQDLTSKVQSQETEINNLREEMKSFKAAISRLQAQSGPVVRT